LFLEFYLAGNPRASREHRRVSGALRAPARARPAPDKQTAEIARARVLLFAERLASVWAPLGMLGNGEKLEQMKNAVIAALVVAVLVLTYRLAEVENQRYALMVGLCSSRTPTPDLKCLTTVQSRTSIVWHVFYALKG
jgi:hypothetical protein